MTAAFSTGTDCAAPGGWCVASSDCVGACQLVPPATAAPPLMPGGESDSAKDRNQGQEPDALHVAYERELARLRAENGKVRAELEQERDKSARYVAAYRRVCNNLAAAVRERDEARTCWSAAEQSLTALRAEVEQLRAGHNDKEKSMTPEQLIAASESKLRDAENNLATCVASLNAAKARNGGVPNHEVVSLAQGQAVIAQAYAALALARAGIEAVPADA